MTEQYTPVPPREQGGGNPAADMNSTSTELAAAGAGGTVLNATYGGGADPAGGAHSTTGLQAAVTALAGAGQLRYPPGTYLYSTALNLPGNGTDWAGAGQDSTEISQTSSSQHGVTSSVTTGLYEIVMSGLTINGPGASSTVYDGIYLTTESGNIEALQLENLRVQ